jgi:hypothetical protein
VYLVLFLKPGVTDFEGEIIMIPPDDSRQHALLTIPRVESWWKKEEGSTPM